MSEVIRRAVEADLPALVALLADDVISAARETPGDLEPYYPAFAEIDADPNQMLMVMDRAGALVGTLHLTRMPSLMRRGRPRANVEAVRVASSERGHGLGARLMAWADDQARIWGCALVQLTSDQGRPGAHRFYERLGYAPSHVGFKKALRDR
jgi:GNAT superfamily N-acetyltransferase